MLHGVHDTTISRQKTPLPKPAISVELVYAHKREEEESVAYCASGYSTCEQGILRKRLQKSAMATTDFLSTKITEKETVKETETEVDIQATEANITRERNT